MFNLKMDKGIEALLLIFHGEVDGWVQPKCWRAAEGGPLRCKSGYRGFRGLKSYLCCGMRFS